MKFPKIQLGWLTPHRFGWAWDGDTRVLLIGLYFVTLGIDFGLTESDWYNHFYRKCPVCYKPLNVNSRSQIVQSHKECRTARRRNMSYKNV